MAFEGYLLKFGDQQLENRFIAYENYKVTPDQRLEVEAYRDANGLLHRITAPQTKTKIEFNTRSGINLNEKIQMFNQINKGLVNEPTSRHQRKYSINYWDDENNIYKSGIFYMPDVEYTIRVILEDGINSNIIYNPIRIAFIEY